MFYFLQQSVNPDVVDQLAKRLAPDIVNQYGPVGAVVTLVIIFLYAMKDRDKHFSGILTEEREARQKVDEARVQKISDSTDKQIESFNKLTEVLKQNTEALVANRLVMERIEPIVARLEEDLNKS